MKPVRFSVHAGQVIVERGLDLDWVIAAAETPDWRTPDPTDTGAERRFLAVADRGGRILRVVCREQDDSILIVTAFFDRRARRPG